MILLACMPSTRKGETFFFITQRSFGIRISREIGRDPDNADTALFFTDVDPPPLSCIHYVAASTSFSVFAKKLNYPSKVTSCRYSCFLSEKISIESLFLVMVILWDNGVFIYLFKFCFVHSIFHSLLGIRDPKYRNDIKVFLKLS